MDKHVEHRLFLLRREMVRAEFLSRAILRIAGDPEGDREDLQGRLQEIEVIAAHLVELIDRTAGEYEPHILKRHAESLGRVADEAEAGGNDET